MQTINATAVIRRNEKGEVEFRIKGRASFLKMVSDFILEKREQCEADVRVRRTALPKSNEQLGYYFGVVCHYAAQGFRAAGFEFMDYKKADYELRMLFFFDEFDTINGKKRYPQSLEAADVVEVAQLIDDAIMFCAQEFSIAVPPPEQKNYKV